MDAICQPLKPCNLRVMMAPTSAACAPDFDTGSGSVTLIGPANFGAEFEISTSSGRLPFALASDPHSGTCAVSSGA